MTDGNGPSDASGSYPERLMDAAHTVQDVAYSMAAQLDNTTMTELMVTSRKLERLATRVRNALGSIEGGRPPDSDQPE